METNSVTINIYFASTVLPNIAIKTNNYIKISRLHTIRVYVKYPSMFDPKVQFVYSL